MDFSILFYFIFFNFRCIKTSLLHKIILTSQNLITPKKIALSSVLLKIKYRMSVIDNGEEFA